MTPDARARVRAVWATLAGVDSFPSRGPIVTVSSASRICPPGWAGVVGLEGGVVATVPHAGLVEPCTRALDALDGVDWAALPRSLAAQEALGPAQLAYAD